MPNESQGALITADRIYWASEGRKGDILENLRLAVEPVIEQHLAVPFRTWCAQHDKLAPSSPQSGRPEPFLRLSRLLGELWGNRQLFEEFSRTAFPQVDRIFWDGLRGNLYNLRNQRGTTAHPEDGGPATIEEISGHYRRFIGIGERGILLDLLALHSRIE